MKIVVSGKSKWMTVFEKREWAKVDQQHYGSVIDWHPKEFKITASEGKTTIGCLRLEIEVGVAYIVAIIVTESQRGTGIGRTLIAEAERIVKEHGSHKIYLQTGKTWGTIAFYQKLGYTVTSELPNHYAHVHFVEMTKFLE